MIMNDKIEETAEEYINSIVNQKDASDYSQDVKNARFDEFDIQSAFFSGANFSLENQWVNINVKLPIDCEPVLGIKDGCYPLVVRYDSSERCFKSVDWNEADIDYWMPIPLLTSCSNNE